MADKGYPETLADFMRYMAVIRNRSALTVEQYEQDLSMFMRWLKAKDDGVPADGDEFAAIDISLIDGQRLAKVTRADVMEFLMYTKDERLNDAKARARKLSAIRSFYRYLVNERIVKDNPAKEVDSPQIRPALPKFLSEDECVKLLETVRSDTESRTRERDYAMITVFLNSGIRLAELVGINLNDMDPELRSMRVTGKGAKERVVYLNEACRAALTDYLQKRDADVQIRDKSALFISSQHNRISPKTVQYIIYKYLDAAGLGNKGFSTHKLRHTAATLMYRSGKVDIRVLKDILGHEQLNTTQIYTHVSDESMKNAMEANPLAHIGEGKESKRSKKE